MTTDTLCPCGATRSTTADPFGQYEVIHAEDCQCTCYGRCAICIDAIGYDTEVECGDCPLHRR